jgi:hypothetical protein
MKTTQSISAAVSTRNRAGAPAGAAFEVRGATRATDPASPSNVAAMTQWGHPVRIGNDAV